MGRIEGLQVGRTAPAIAGQSCRGILLRPGCRGCRTIGHGKKEHCRSRRNRRGDRSNPRRPRPAPAGARRSVRLREDGPPPDRARRGGSPADVDDRPGSRRHARRRDPARCPRRSPRHSRRRAAPARHRASRGPARHDAHIGGAAAAGRSEEAPRPSRLPDADDTTGGGGRRPVARPARRGGETSSQAASTSADKRSSAVGSDVRDLTACQGRGPPTGAPS